MESKVHLIDCVEFMRGLSDKAFDLAVVDPPYGVGEDGLKNHSRSKIAKSKEYTPKQWDKNPPNGLPILALESLFKQPYDVRCGLSRLCTRCRYREPLLTIKDGLLVTGHIWSLVVYLHNLS